MKLPDDSIGISDILAHRECARRMSFGMRRHVGRGEQSDAQTPEADVAGAVWARGYGSAIHEAQAAIEDGYDEEAAIQQAWNRYGRFLVPEDLERLREDVALLRLRDFPNTRTIAAEDDFRVPLLKHDGVQIYFRFRLDRLYERVDSAGTFIHVDYKSSKWLKSRAEVESDLQLWTYNWGIHEYFPECDELLQFYDQLRGGQGEAIRKSEAQRRQVRDWLVEQVTTILEDEDLQPDGLLAHSLNQWCPWCPILESCPVVPQLTDWSLTRIAALAPVRPKLKKDGTPGKQLERVPLEDGRLEEYLEVFDKSKTAAAVLERYQEGVKDLLRKMPEERRSAHGYEVRQRTSTFWTQQAREALQERLGGRFLDAVRITKAGLESALADEPELLAWALQLADKEAGAEVVQRVDGG